MKMKNEWKIIRFGVSPELHKKLSQLKGSRRWWEFFRDEYKDE